MTPGVSACGLLSLHAGKQFSLLSTSEEATGRLAALLAAEMRAGDAYCLKGDQGGGKTTFRQARARGRPVREFELPGICHVVLAGLHGVPLAVPGLRAVCSCHLPAMPARISGLVHTLAPAAPAAALLCVPPRATRGWRCHGRPFRCSLRSTKVRLGGGRARRGLLKCRPQQQPGGRLNPLLPAHLSRTVHSGSRCTP